MTGKARRLPGCNSLGVELARCIYIDPLKAILVNKTTSLLTLRQPRIFLTRTAQTVTQKPRPPIIMPHSRAMEKESHRPLIGGALFLQSSEQVQGTAQRHPRSFLPQGDPSGSDRKFAKAVKGLLDSMTLLLVLEDGGRFVTACGLDQPADRSTLKRLELDDPAPATDAITGEGYQDQEPPNFTLRVARNGPFNELENQKLSKLATKIINFRQSGCFPTYPSLVKNSNISARHRRSEENDL